MKKIIISCALILALPILATAAEPKMDAPAKPAAKEHHMQNSNPDAVQAPEAAPAATSEPATADAPKAPEHTMKNN